MHFMYSQRGQRLLLHEGYKYYKDRYTDLGWQWRCVNKRCLTKVYLDNNESTIISQEAKHHHTPMPDILHQMISSAIEDKQKEVVQTQQQNDNKNQTTEPQLVPPTIISLNPTRRKSTISNDSFNVNSETDNESEEVALEEPTDVAQEEVETTVIQNGIAASPESPPPVEKGLPEPVEKPTPMGIDSTQQLNSEEWDTMGDEGDEIDVPYDELKAVQAEVEWESQPVNPKTGDFSHLSMRIVKSKRGNDVLEVNDHFYWKSHLLADGRCRWRCSKRRVYDCSAQIFTFKSYFHVIEASLEHNHGVEPPLLADDQELVEFQSVDFKPPPPALLKKKRKYNRRVKALDLLAVAAAQPIKAKRKYKRKLLGSVAAETTIEASQPKVDETLPPAVEISAVNNVDPDFQYEFTLEDEFPELDTETESIKPKKPGRSPGRGGRRRKGGRTKDSGYKPTRKVAKRPKEDYNTRKSRKKPGEEEMNLSTLLNEVETYPSPKKGQKFNDEFTLPKKTSNTFEEEIQVQPIPTPKKSSNKHGEGQSSQKKPSNKIEEELPLKRSSNKLDDEFTGRRQSNKFEDYQRKRPSNKYDEEYEQRDQRRNDKRYPNEQYEQSRRSQKKYQDDYDDRRSLRNNDNDRRPLRNVDDDDRRPLRNIDDDDRRPLRNSDDDDRRPLRNNDDDRRPLRNDDDDRRVPRNNDDDRRVLRNNDDDRRSLRNNNGEYDERRRRSPFDDYDDRDRRMNNVEEESHHRDRNRRANNVDEEPVRDRGRRMNNMEEESNHRDRGRRMNNLEEEPNHRDRSRRMNNMEDEPNHRRHSNKFDDEYKHRNNYDDDYTRRRLSNRYDGEYSNSRRSVNRFDDDYHQRRPMNKYDEDYPPRRLPTGYPNDDFERMAMKTYNEQLNKRKSLALYESELNQLKTEEKLAEESSSEAKKMFLLSLLPDFRRMTDKQQRVFKTKVLDIVCSIIES